MPPDLRLRSLVGERRWAWLAVGAAAAAVAAVALLPWHRSGEVVRSGFELARVADNLGVVTSAPRRGLLTALFLLPMAAALVLLAVAGRWWRCAGVASSLTGAVGLASASVAVRVTDQVHAGPLLAGAASALALVAGARLTWRMADHE